MNDINKLCKGCMKYTMSEGICAECGFEENNYKNLPHHLKPGTVLAGKYMIGKKLGEGGFGITYIGIDLNLNMRVAVKEFFPSGCVTRDTDRSDTIVVFDGEEFQIFEHGRNKFIEEARTIAQFNDTDGIVSVKDFFLENGTAYIVMEYLDGENLKDFLRKKGGRMRVDEALAMLKPVMESLSQLHREGLIHRDISPDNIMITKNSRVKLIDFGAARDISTNGQKSLSIQLKPGYAPEEQYRTHGKQGPWTDVYALCATIYRMITGVVPEESNERLIQDSLKTPTQTGIDINPEIEAALMKGLSVNHNSRIQSIDELYSAFYTGVSNTYRQSAIRSENRTKGNNDIWKTAIIALSVMAVVGMCIFGILITGSVDFDSSGESGEDVVSEEITNTPTPTPPATPTPLPPRPDLYNPNLTYKRMPGIHSSYLVSDSEYIDLRDTLLNFNDKCIRYVNYGETDVLEFFVVGSNAYKMQTNYKNDNSGIYEELNNVNVINARYDGESYYVWVAEDRTITKDGVSTDKTDHWVYRMKKTGGRYLIADYTYDPLYNN